jgi:hypothetical protein
VKIRMLRPHAEYRTGQILEISDSPGEMWVTNGLAERVFDSLLDAVATVSAKPVERTTEQPKPVKTGKPKGK